jgi:8-oxo-dGTP pyrophosphatase MutT (NUDIX family)
MVKAVSNAVSGFDAKTEREAASKARFVVELKRLPHPFDRDADPVHVTASGLVLGRRGTVLHVHKRLRIWLQPGGHIDEGEAPWAAALRESREETGLPLRHPESGHNLVHLDAHDASQGHFHLDMRYLLLSDDVEPSPPSGESQQVRWVSLEEAEQMCDSGLVEALGRLQVIAAGGGA